MVGCSASGTLLPAAVIVFVSTSAADQQKTRFIRDLAKTPEFADWTLGTWEGEVELMKAGKPSMVKFRRFYLQNPETLDLVWGQQRAWMDRPGVVMWFELCLMPYIKKMGGRPTMLVWDNCPAHTSEWLKIKMEGGIGGLAGGLGPGPLHTRLLAPDTTDERQPMDVAFNASLKAGARRARGRMAYRYMTEYREMTRTLNYGKALADHVYPPYSPPAPSLAEGLAMIFELLAAPEYKDNAKNEKFKSGMRRTFVRCGLAPDESGAFYCPSAPLPKVLPTFMKDSDEPTGEGAKILNLLAPIAFEKRPAADDDSNEAFLSDDNEECAC